MGGGWSGLRALGVCMGRGYRLVPVEREERKDMHSLEFLFVGWWVAGSPFQASHQALYYVDTHLFFF
jgi:hypothetical protein